LSGYKQPFSLAKGLVIFHLPSMHSHELMREVLERTSAKQISDDLKLSESMVYKWGQPRASGSGVSNPLDRIEAFLQSTGDHRLVQWICQRAGGFFIQNPKTPPHPHYLIPATNQIVQDFADLLHVVAQAANDNEITPAEARQIRERWEELKSVTEGFVTGCEKGDFDHIREHAARRTTATAP
jgi:Phage regulatory protein CII (CP76)